METTTASNSARVVALLPAHNEEDQIAAALDGLLAQTIPADHIVVIVDNCTDTTEEIARAYALEHPNVRVLITQGNTAKKAGALNQALPLCSDSDYILDTDADAVLAPDFTERALAILGADATIGAVSAREGVKTYAGLSRWQRVLYRAVRYQRHLWDSIRLEHAGQALVVGPGGLFRTAAVMSVGGWQEDSLTEDNAISLDLRLSGWRTVLGRDCYVWSDSPLSLSELWRQRVRWARGAEDYAARPWRRCTWRGKAAWWWSWFLAVWTGFAMASPIVTHGFNLVWMTPLAVLWADRLARVARWFPAPRGLDMVMTFPLIDIGLFGATKAFDIAAVWQRLTNRQRSW